LLDVREVDVGMSKHVVVERLRVLLDQLGPKSRPGVRIDRNRRGRRSSENIPDGGDWFRPTGRTFRAARQWLNALR
jgi:hypothetical protein